MHFASFYEPLIGPLLKSLRMDVLKLIKAEHGKTYLDCCCGAGGMLNLAESETYLTHVGIDLSSNMLKQAQKNTSQAHFCCADATCLPFNAHSFDIASVCMALHAIPLHDALACVEELMRVAKRVIIADYCLLERNAYAPSYLLANTIERLVGGTHYRCYKEFMKIGALEGFLRHAGYTTSTNILTLGGSARVVMLA